MIKNDPIFIIRILCSCDMCGQWGSWRISVGLACSRRGADLSSCGCADSCWVAEVRQAKAEKPLIAKLRCDCEKLYFTDKTGIERVVAENCDDLNTDNKVDLILERINQLQSHFNTPR
uniref:hypothetical protein n=1 Tax=Shewanella putrefaciens TaxID=24 RepID=UPI0027DDA601|nr:hypothetical protein [Shewanella putrefaciens]